MNYKPEKLTRAQMEQRRMEGAALLREGRLSQAEIAWELGVSRATVSDWAKRLEAGGVRALRSHKSSGRPPKLTPAQQKVLVRHLKRGALAAGFETERWTSSRIQQVIQREFGVKYHVRYLPRLLHALGWSRQLPLARASERADDLVQAWLEQDWPRIKKARRNGVTIVFYDEFGFSFRELLGRTWAPKGQRPILRRRTHARRALSMGVGLTVSGQIFTRQFDKAMRSAEVIITLRHLLRHLAHGFVLIWDRAPIHKSQVVTAYLSAHPEIKAEWLPAYAPDVNPEEYCHGNVKHRLRNATPTTAHEIRTLVHRGFARLRHRPDLLLSFVHAAGLSVRKLW